MSNFNIRVELHGANQSDYRILVQEMAARGMSDVIVGANNLRYRLPPGEYCISTQSSINQVRDAARAAAAATNRTFAVRVTEGQSSWAGLDQA